MKTWYNMRSGYPVEWKAKKHHKTQGPITQYKMMKFLKKSILKKKPRRKKPESTRAHSTNLPPTTRDVD
jgi:hypothetical protein